MDDFSETLPESTPVCPVCGGTRLECDRPDCPKLTVAAEAALCQQCGAEHGPEVSCEEHQVASIRKAAIDTPFKLGI